uniref:Uncharacterized protein LOC114342581 n=1 Tax=Diabrotica virgifera virgifera TaxID=50390 RepID=A0A6P7GZJ2_DIAVI
MLLDGVGWPGTLKTFLSSFDIKPSIKDYTRIQGNKKSCIDNIFTNLDIFDSVIFNPHTSDHTAQKVKFELNNIDSNITKKRIFNNENKDSFKLMLSNVDWVSVIETLEVDDQWDTFMNIVQKIFVNCFPLKEINTTNKKKSQQCLQNDDIKNCKSRLDVLFTLSSNNDEYKDIYRAEKRKYNALLTQYRKNCYKERIENSENKTKMAW